ncbi:preprotein translocase subunit SecA [Virgibacillus pantothenticus]|uniref:Rho termination factor N-terminal domain-containing protein n=1 Tax=Virgibacillus pantothenticus TaxID=1473 RepID=UPI001B1BBC4F|nr:Rho termination factor N-terminal domain-containing protein [Virgibacillus pantothenticus]MBU8568036.1 SEC-C domain-containing protein [Virgibacillus pantothenticus]MBU8601708.1 SEC-C domain-containing protein [Virgibacillus pantothenticus]MBU8636082.1 SEC-C domain-containing protein [Virgibacillus pantothenticus]MBU8643544.1 SEC-C domain-containing protein [Virgibacillus pantothenticus]MBU8647686.1 SEC-C domain-containing protein [Virgibacillus pantothenticus]
MNKEDINIEHVFEEFERIEIERLKKQSKKQWQEILFPLTLHDALNRYTKAELDTIRKKLDIKNASSLKKAELIQVLEQNIPEHLKRLIFLWDMDRFKVLLNIAENGGKIIAPDLDHDQMEYLRRTGLVYTGTLEGNRVLTVPEEMLAPITALKHDINVRATIKRNTKWIKLTRGLLYYYGVLNVHQMIHMVEKYMKEDIDFKSFVDVIADSMHFCPEIVIDMEGFSHIDVLEPKKVKQEQKMRESVPFYPFTEQQLLEAGEPGFVDRNASYQQLVHFLTRNYEMDKADADAIVEECAHAIKSGEGPGEVLKYLSHVLEFDSEQAVKALMDKIIHLMNNTREWFLKGHAPYELLEIEKSSLLTSKPNSSAGQKSNSSSSQKVVKIGRNQPCPCGSGKKYKKCCGR